MRIFILFFCLLSATAFCQPVIVSHSLPPGYTNTELRNRNQLKIDAAGNKWIAFAGIGLGKYDGTAWTIFNTINSVIPSDSVTSIDFDANGNAWIGTKLGAAFFDGTTFQVFTTQNSGLISNLVNCVTVDGNDVWLGTNEGVVKYTGSFWITYTTQNSGLANDTVRKILNDAASRTWFATKQGLSVLDASVWETFSTANSIMPSQTIFDMAEDDAGRIWFSTTLPGIYYVEAGLVKNLDGDYYTEMITLQTQSRTAFARAVNGTVYFMTKYGEWLFEISGAGYKIYYMSPYQFNVTGIYGYDLEARTPGELWYLNLFSPSPTDVFKSIDLNAYQVPPFLAPTHHNSKTLNINDVSALMLNRGDMHWDLETWGYEVPKGSGKMANLAAALWIGGLDAGGNLHTAAQSYRQSGNDYWPGPISGISQPFDSASCIAYDKMYGVYKWEIEQFLVNYLNGSVSNGTYPVPTNLLEWPATGNAGITDDKAPFFDFNSNGLYSPYEGDYPLIKGDQMLFWMFNDSLAAHSYTDTERIGVEVHGSAYAYACPGIADSNRVINYTTLYNYRIINRSQRSYNGVYVGLWNSGSLGDITDDYMGSDSVLAAAFIYNGDNNDQSYPMQINYGLNPPMQNLVFLQGMEADAGDGIDNNLNGITDEPGERTTMNHFISADGPNNSPIGNPQSGTDHYNYMQSKWLDGLQLTAGSDGRDPSNPPTNFMYSGTPYTTQWNEQTSGNASYERVFVASSGPVSLPSAGEISIDFAYVFTHDSTAANGLTTSIARNVADVQRVKNWFATNTFPACINYYVGAAETVEPVNLVAYPNPAHGQLFLNIHPSPLPCFYEVSDVSGRVILKGTYDTQGIATHALREGYYVVRVNAGGSIRTTRFIKITNR